MTSNSGQNHTTTALKSGCKYIVSALGVCFVLFVVGTLGLFVFTYVQTKDNIGYVVEKMSTADATLVPLNDVINSTDQATCQQFLPRLQQEQDSCINALNDAQEKLTHIGAYRSFLLPQQKEALDTLQQSITARKDLLRLGTQILSGADTQAKIATNVEQAINLSLEADGAIKQSVAYSQQLEQALSQNHNAELDFGKALELDQQAQQKLAQAQSLLTEADQLKGVCIWPDFGKYLEQKKQAASALFKADSLMAHGNFSEAVTVLETYDTCDKQAAELAQNLEAQKDGVMASITQESADTQQQYTQALSVAAECDAKIRTYR